VNIPLISHLAIVYVTPSSGLCSATTATQYAYLHVMTFTILQVTTMTSMKKAVFWDVPTCSLVDADRRFREAYGLHPQSDRSDDRRNIPETTILIIIFILLCQIIVCAALIRKNIDSLRQQICKVAKNVSTKYVARSLVFQPNIISYLPAFVIADVFLN
jgi:hypothetical protein